MRAVIRGGSFVAAVAAVAAVGVSGEPAGGPKSDIERVLDAAIEAGEPVVPASRRPTPVVPAVDPVVLPTPAVTPEPTEPAASEDPAAEETGPDKPVVVDPADCCPPPDGQPPEIEVVFCLDTTGSMGGLIAAAKDKIWAIANTLAQATPTPVIRFGLVGYRDRGDEYVTRRLDLTTDLDAVYSELYGYSATGGGDSPESVNQALFEAVNDFAWSDEKHVYRVVYLVGDAPPHMDYQDDVKYGSTCGAARGRDIIINAIQCGSMSGTGPIWREIAKLGGGRYLQIAQTGGRVVSATPYDAEIAELSARLDATRVWYGRADDVARQEERLSEVAEVDAAAPASVRARRGVYNASEPGKLNFFGGSKAVGDTEFFVLDAIAEEAADADVDELVVAITSGRLGDDADVEQLPADWQKLTPEERKAKATGIAAERESLRAKIAELGKKRQAHIEADLEKRGEDTP
ncbi:MAG: vWA domain-containing protein, partial [Planctomycetota bacterium]